MIIVLGIAFIASFFVAYRKSKCSPRDFFNSKPVKIIVCVYAVLFAPLTGSALYYTALYPSSLLGMFLRPVQKTDVSPCG